MCLSSPAAGAGVAAHPDADSDDLLGDVPAQQPTLPHSRPSHDSPLLDELLTSEWAPVQRRWPWPWPRQPRRSPYRLGQRLRPRHVLPVLVTVAAVLAHRGAQAPGQSSHAPPGRAAPVPADRPPDRYAHRRRDSPKRAVGAHATGRPRAGRRPPTASHPPRPVAIAAAPTAGAPTTTSTTVGPVAPSAPLRPRGSHFTTEFTP